MLAPLLPPWLGLVILGAVTVAIIKVQPAVVLANSRTLYTFSADRIFPAFLARVHPRYGTPHHALTVTARGRQPGRHRVQRGRRTFFSAWTCSSGRCW